MFRRDLGVLEESEESEWPTVTVSLLLIVVLCRWGGVKVICWYLQIFS